MANPGRPVDEISALRQLLEEAEAQREKEMDTVLLDPKTSY
jgi:hypothetical protein